MDKKPSRPLKLSRKQIDTGLAEMPIASILLGATAPGERRLTAKQAKFAEELARGSSKAGAYRAAYDVRKMSPMHTSAEGQKLAKHPLVARQIEALRLAQEAKKHATPAALRQLVVERLTAHAIDEEIPPAQRLRALELLGKITEVAAFTERREIIKTSDPGQARLALLESLRAALRANSVDAEVVPVGASLLEELSPSPIANAAQDVQPQDETECPSVPPADEPHSGTVSPSAPTSVTVPEPTLAGPAHTSHPAHAPDRPDAAASADAHPGRRDDPAPHDPTAWAPPGEAEGRGPHLA